MDNTEFYKYKWLLLAIFLLMQFSVEACSCFFPKGHTVWSDLSNYDLIIFATVIKHEGEICTGRDSNYCQPEFTELKVERILKGETQKGKLLFKNGWGANCGNSLRWYKSEQQIFIKLNYAEIAENESEIRVYNDICDTNVLKIANNRISIPSRNLIKRFWESVKNNQKKVQEIGFYKAMNQDRYTKTYMKLDKFIKRTINEIKAISKH